MTLKTLVLGMGNTLAGDDGIGVLVAREIARRLPPQSAGEVTVRESSESYFVLLDYCDRYDRIIVVDAMVSAVKPAGRVLRLEPEAFEPGRAPSLSHGASPAAILSIAAAATGRPVADIVFIAVTVDGAFAFGEELTPPVRGAWGPAVRAVEQELLTGDRVAPHPSCAALAAPA